MNETTHTVMEAIGIAINRMRTAQRAWSAQEPKAESGPVIRADVARAIRAGALLSRSPDDYLMAFGIGGSNPCRSEPVVLPLWDSLSDEEQSRGA